MPVAAMGLAIARPGAAQETLEGRVLDAETLRPIAAAGVAIDGLLRLETGPDGTFLVQLPEHRRLEVVVEHADYLPHTQAVAWNRDGQVQHFLLRPSPIILPAVTARVGRVWRPPPLGGFYERQAIGVGYFLDREALDGAGRRVSDAFRLVPGIAVECGFNPHACTLRFTRTRDSAWDGRCPIQYYVDGAPLRIESIDEMFGPDEIGGIEIYNAATVPARFKSARSARCGVIVIWTRR